MLRAAEGERGERGEQHGSSDRMDLHSAAAAAPSAAVACAAPSAAAIAAAVAAAAAADGADSGSGSGSVWEGLSTLQPHVGTSHSGQRLGVLSSLPSGSRLGCCGGCGSTITTINFARRVQGRQRRESSGGDDIPL
ncbi:hypothetical protein CLOP_g9080 [Closterium sp. NIES-67]|nr:hypothetical protein CLOP_g9080 [Closterium sp. NIES-67]